MSQITIWSRVAGFFRSKTRALPADRQALITGGLSFIGGLCVASIGEVSEDRLHTPLGSVFLLILVLALGIFCVTLFGVSNAKKLDRLQEMFIHVEEETTGLLTALNQHDVKVRYHILPPRDPSKLYKHNMKLFRDAKKSYRVLNYHLGRVGREGMAYSEAARNSKIREEYYELIEREVSTKSPDFRYNRIIQLNGVNLSDIKDPLFIRHLRWISSSSVGREEARSVQIVPLHLEGTFIIVDDTRLFWQVSTLADDQYGHDGFFEFVDPRKRLISAFASMFDRLTTLGKPINASDLDGSKAG